MSKEIKLTRGLCAIVDDADYDQLSKYSWHATVSNQNKIYAARRENVFHGRKIVKMHRQIMNADESKVVDHINGNTLDNRRSNLRVCSYAENSRNRVRNRNGVSGFKGVRWSKKSQKWEARITLNGKESYLGVFERPEDAAREYDRVARNYHGDFARLNF